MQILNDTIAIPTIAVNSAVASGGDCVITLNAVAGNRHTIDHIIGGYYATPAANSTLIVHDVTNNTDLLSVPVSAAGPFMLPFGDRGLQAPIGAGLTLTLLDGNAIKSLSIQYR